MHPTRFASLRSATRLNPTVRERWRDMELRVVVDDFLDALAAVDGSGKLLKQFQPGFCPSGEPQLLKVIAEHFNGLARYPKKVLLSHQLILHI